MSGLVIASIVAVVVWVCVAVGFAVAVSAGAVGSEPATLVVAGVGGVCVFVGAVGAWARDRHKPRWESNHGTDAENGNGHGQGHGHSHGTNPGHSDPLVSTDPHGPPTHVFNLVRELQLVAAYVQYRDAKRVVLSTQFKCCWVSGSRTTLQTYLVSALRQVFAEVQEGSIVHVAIKSAAAGPVRPAQTVQPAAAPWTPPPPIAIRVTYPAVATSTGQSMLQTVLPILAHPAAAPPAGPYLRTDRTDRTDPAHFTHLAPSPKVTFSRSRGFGVGGGSGGVGGATTPAPDEDMLVPVDLASVPEVVLQAMLLPKPVFASGSSAGPAENEVSAVSIVPDARSKTTTMTMTLSCHIVPTVVVLESDVATVREIKALLDNPGVVVFGQYDVAKQALTPAAMQYVTHVFVSIVLPVYDGRDVCRFFRKGLGYQGIVVGLVGSAPAEALAIVGTPDAETNTREHYSDIGFDFILQKRPLARDVFAAIMHATGGCC